jgi:uncharacterized protein (TIGR03437 family)
VDAFYPANTRVQIYSTSKLGYRFKHWEGDTVDRFSPATVTVSGPLRLTAVLEAVPEIDRAGVRNGAGETPVKAVAPGSIITVFGANLASGTEAATSKPLPQAIAGTTVHVGGSILPLLFVSPEQINAQLPYDLPIGANTLTIKSKGMPDVSTAFDVVRNAPGLLTNLRDDRAIAAASRPSGPAVDSDNPIRSGELINIFGTGFGPHRISPPEGFAVNESDPFRIVDSVQVMVGNDTVTPEYAGAATGLPGVVVVRFRTPSALSQQDLTVVKVMVNGVSSNEAILPNAAAFSVSTGVQEDAAAKEDK